MDPLVKRCVAITLKGFQCKNNKNKKCGQYCGIHNYKNEVIPENTKKELECSICYETVDNTNVAILISCGHHYCMDCINNWLITKSTCPLCRNEVTDYEKNIAYLWGIASGKLVKSIIHKYVGTFTLTTSEQLNFIEYLDVWFSGPYIFDQEDWNSLIRYIEYDPAILKIFKKMSMKVETKYIAKTKIPQNVEIKKEYKFYRFVF
jgi:hypothetical protein